MDQILQFCWDFPGFSRGVALHFTQNYNTAMKLKLHTCKVTLDISHKYLKGNLDRYDTAEWLDVYLWVASPLQHLIL